MFETLKTLVLAEIENSYNEKIEEIKTEEGYNRVATWYGKKYTKNPEKKLTKFLEKKRDEEINEMIEKIENVEKADDFKNDFVITIEWKKSQMWGYNPHVYTNTGFEYHTISGCGYDKQSTVTAEALNSNLCILKLMYEKKEEYLNKPNNTNISNEEIFGYGCGYGILPDFHGGVGVSCHERILNTIGLNMNHISNTDSTDVFIISKIEE